MNAGTILIIILSQQGYWFGGDTGTLRVQWPTNRAPTESVLVWKLVLGEAQLAEGRLPLSGDGKASLLSVTAPEVRVRTRVRWVYSVQARDGGKELASGEATLEVFPNTLLSGVGERLEGKRLVVWDKDGPLTRFLSDKKIAHRRVQDSASLQTLKADMILVAPDQLDGSKFAQAPLLGQAAAGASVFVFTQPRAKYLAGYSITRRMTPPELQWRRVHPLFRGFGQEDLSTFLKEAKDLHAVQLPADEPALELAWWPPEVDSSEPVPIDALVVAKAVESGRIVLCALPLGAWDRDPRSQMLLGGILDYLQTRAEPTLPLSRRRVEQRRLPASMPTITIPPGGSP